MQYDLNGKRALVTGASRGLGRAIALSLARAGADVAITWEKSADKAQAVAEEIRALGRTGVAFTAVARILAIAEEVFVAHRGLFRMVKLHMGNVVVVIRDADHHFSGLA